MTKEKSSRGNRHVVLSSGCRSLQFVPGFGSPALPGNNPSPADGPFRGLVICVTGLSKEARIQVQDATERMGGHYSPDLHPQCTHLVVQSCTGRKFEHALKHGVKRGLSIVTLSWFINSAKLNARLDESQYTVSKSVLRNLGVSPDNRLLETSGEQVCLPSRIEDSRSFSPVKSHADSPPDLKPGPLLKGYKIFLDPSLSEDMQSKVVAAATKEGASFVENWFTGSNATHIVCEKDSFLTYTGSSSNLITPLWLLKSLKENSLQRLVQFSADLARHLAFVVDAPSKTRTAAFGQVETIDGERSQQLSSFRLQAERQESVRIAKENVRKRRGQRKQPCRTLPRPITPMTLLESVCWSVTEPPSTARLYVDRSPESLLENEFFDSFENGNTSGSESGVYTRALKETERQEIVYSGVFLTILFPVDRFAEMGPSSRVFFSSKGFTRQQVMEHIHEFYQEVLTEEEMSVAINTDSKHADKLRVLYGGGAKDGEAPSMKRCEFIGSRRSFEGLKRLSRENTGQVYELWLGA